MNKQLRTLIYNTNGRFFTVDFLKRDGSMRHMVARIGVKKHVNGRGMSYNPSDYGLMTVWDSVKKNYRMINLATVSYFRCGRISLKIKS